MDSLVKVAQGGVTLHIHESAVEQHEQLGWNRVTEEPQAEQEEVSEELNRSRRSKAADAAK